MSPCEKIELGCIARDVATGFQGVVTARCDYLAGYVQYQLETYGDPSELPKTTWIESGRLMFVERHSSE
jgi:hypothetical protein